MRLKNSKILELYQTLTIINGVKNTNFNYTKALNKASIKRKAETLQETQTQLQEILKPLNDEHHALLIKYAEKDKNKNPIIKAKTGYFTHYEVKPENQVKIENELKKLREGKYKKEVAKYEKEAKNFEKILNQEQEVDIVKFKQKDLPDDLDDVIDVLFDFIETPAEK